VHEDVLPGVVVVPTMFPFPLCVTVHVDDVVVIGVPGEPFGAAMAFGVGYIANVAVAAIITAASITVFVSIKDYYKRCSIREFCVTFRKNLLEWYF